MPNTMPRRVNHPPEYPTQKYANMFDLGLSVLIWKKKIYPISNNLIIENSGSYFEFDIAPDLSEETQYIADKFPKMKSALKVSIS